MKRLSALLWTTLLTSWIVASQARADFMNWSYSTVADSPVITGGNSSIQLTGITTGKSGSTIDLLGLQESTNTKATSATPDSFDGSFKVSVKITDNGTHDSGTLTLSGTVKNNSPDPGVTVKLSSDGLSLDGQKYMVSPSVLTIKPNAPQETISAPISVSAIGGSDGSGGNGSGGTGGSGGDGGTGGGAGGGAGGGGGGDISGVPEPASLVLGTLGLTLLGVGGGWRQIRRRTIVAA
jgi:hypothetical protein